MNMLSMPVMPAASTAVEVVLRDYQDRLVDKVRVAFREKHKAVLLVAGTGAGKTVMFSYIAKNAAARGSRVLILAHRDTLIKQASKKLRENGVQHGIIMAGFSPNLQRSVQVASVQTLVRRLPAMLKRGEKFDLIVVDEAHLSAAGSYMKIFEAFPEARILGVTGSPIRLDGKGLGRSAGCVYDIIVQDVTIKGLIEQGYLVKPVYYASRETIDLSSVKKSGNDYETESLAAVMDKPKITGSAIAQWRKICPGVPAVAWCVNVRHAQHVAAEFNAAGIPALALSGDSTAEEREDALRRMEDGTLKIITFAMLLVEGVDCPAIGAVILLRPTMSLSSYLQVIGRGLRTIYAPGFPLNTIMERFAAMDAGPKGRKCYVLDHASLVTRHGFADEVRDWDLEGVKKGKGKKKEERAIPVAQCPSCFMVHEPAPQCPGCGHIYQVKLRDIEHVDGDLQEITPEMEEEIKRRRKGEVRSAKSLEELQKIGAERGYHPRWAEHTFAAKQRKRSASNWR